MYCFHRPSQAPPVVVLPFCFTLKSLMDLIIVPNMMMEPLVQDVPPLYSANRKAVEELDILASNLGCYTLPAHPSPASPYHSQSSYSSQCSSPPVSPPLPHRSPHHSQSSSISSSQSSTPPHPSPVSPPLPHRFPHQSQSCYTTSSSSSSPCFSPLSPRQRTMSFQDIMPSPHRKPPSLLLQV